MSKMNEKQFSGMSGRVKFIVITIVGAVIILAIATIVFIQLLQQNTGESNDGPTASQLAERDALVALAERDKVTYDDAKAALQKGNITGAKQVYADAIKSETSTTRKIQIYIDESGLLYESGNVKEAISAAKSAEVLTEDKFLVADWLSRIYEDQKNYELAAEYYTLAGKWATSPTNLTGLDKKYYDDNASRVMALEFN